MTINYLVPDSDSGFVVTEPASVRLSATTGVSASFGIPKEFSKVWVSVPTIASGTIDLKASIGASYRTVGYDVFNNTFPKTGYTGNSTLFFLAPAGAACVVALSATGTGANLKVVAGK